VFIKFTSKGFDVNCSRRYKHTNGYKYTHHVLIHHKISSKHPLLSTETFREYLPVSTSAIPSHFSDDYISLLKEGWRQVEVAGGGDYSLVTSLRLCYKDDLFLKDFQLLDKYNMYRGYELKIIDDILYKRNFIDWRSIFCTIEDLEALKSIIVLKIKELDHKLINEVR
jgi:hypothetical protein